MPIYRDHVVYSASTALDLAPEAEARHGVNNQPSEGTSIIYGGSETTPKPHFHRNL
jgi:hypothetical protein